MSRQEQHLARELGRESAHLLEEHPCVELSAVRKAVPPDAIVINIARFPVLPFVAGPLGGPAAVGRLLRDPEVPNQPRGQWPRPGGAQSLHAWQGRPGAGRPRL
jgi:hypothetical protein